MASTYTGDVIIAGNQYMRYRGYFEANGYSINDSQYRIDYYARVEMTQAYEWGVGISVDGGNSATGVLTSDPGHNWWKVAEVSGSFTINRETYDKTHTIYCNAYGTQVGYYGSAGGSTRAQLSFNVPARPRYGVFYNANGGTGAPSAQYHYYGYDMKLSSVKPIREGYTFLGWSKSDTATTASYQPNQNWGGTNGNTTLYAVWKRVEVSIMYNAVYNGGSVNGGNTYTKNTYYGEKVGSMPVAEKANYDFLGWNTKTDGTGSYIDSDLILKSNVIVYAIYKLKANCYTKDSGEQKTAMMYLKVDGKYITGTLYIKVNGEYKQATI
jgi:uncharacterized repeat protein (TIGR02543 family)